MPLFQIQDDDRPAFVVAGDFGEAIQKWRAAVRRENADDPESVADPLMPQGCIHVADDTDLILDTDWREPLHAAAQPV